MLNIQSITTADSLEQALQLLSERRYKILAGGTDIIPQMRSGAHTNAWLLDLSNLRGKIRQIWLEAGYLYLGGLCTHDQIAHDPLVLTWCAPLAAACSRIGSAQVRKRGTIAGNLINASPAADSAPVLIAAGAQAILVSPCTTRNIAVQSLATRPGRTCLTPDELLYCLRIPLDGKPWQGQYHKVGPRNALFISVASMAILFHPSFGHCIACGSVGPTVVRANHCEKIFHRSDMRRDDFYQALQQDISPIDDVRASAGYRRQVLMNLLYQSYIEKEAQ